MFPRFSIRHILWGMVGIALLSFCMSSAWRGNRISFGVSVAIIGSIIPLCAYLVVHWSAFVLASVPALISGRGMALDGAKPDANSVEADRPDPAGTTDESVEVNDAS